MPSATQKPSKNSSSPKAARSDSKRATGTADRSTTDSVDAVELLKADHKQVADWFEQFESARSESSKQELAQQICSALTVHATIEEEIFYPAFLDATGETDLHHEAEVEHQGAKVLIADIEASGPEDEYFDAKVKVLAELVRHHVNEEEQGDGMFAKARESEMDLDSLGEQLQARKDEMAEVTPPQRRAG
jgi:hemerythrin superfamily protein